MIKAEPTPTIRVLRRSYCRATTADGDRNIVYPQIQLSGVAVGDLISSTRAQAFNAPSQKVPTNADIAAEGLNPGLKIMCDATTPCPCGQAASSNHSNAHIPRLRAFSSAGKSWDIRWSDEIGSILSSLQEVVLLSDRLSDRRLRNA